ncbi:DUF695 domain-containing protein [Massilia scottii]|uniref:DUF695 domain-containing protein n=1 Tax=Massilia scottii TaxID=3057166 RepID=UPI00279647B3|nr:DUF695 domain-containing protein [Massilia sp. CCM 9029]MDQ1832036.1 DUF695 domain-containing protein [Massilia sp. CCM 9029]
MKQTKEHLPIERLADVGNDWYIGGNPGPDEPFLLKINMAADVWAGHPVLDIRLDFGIMFNQPNPGGRPDDVESDKVDAIGERIHTLLKNAGPAVHAYTFTNGEYKTFTFHIHNREAVPRIHQQIQAETTLYTVDCAGESDTAWTSFAEVRSKCAPPGNLN